MKNTKKTKNSHSKKTKTIISTDNEMSKLIFLVLIVAAVFVVFYLITLSITKDDNKGTTDEQSYQATIQYKKILAGNILNQEPSEYYVLAYFNDDQYVSLYKNHLLNYETKKGEAAVPYYYVDLDEVFNKEFIGEESKLNVTDAKEFKFSQTALIRVQNGKVISTYETKDVITAKFGRMSK